MTIVLKYIIHSSLWGNMYRHRYYVGGRRTSKAEFDRAFASAGLLNADAKVDRGHTWRRYTWVETLRRPD